MPTSVGWLWNAANGVHDEVIGSVGSTRYGCALPPIQSEALQINVGRSTWRRGNRVIDASMNSHHMQHTAHQPIADVVIRDHDARCEKIGSRVPALRRRPGHGKIG